MDVVNFPPALTYFGISMLCFYYFFKTKGYLHFHVGMATFLLGTSSFMYATARPVLEAMEDVSWDTFRIYWILYSESEYALQILGFLWYYWLLVGRLALFQQSYPIAKYLEKPIKGIAAFLLLSMLLQQILQDVSTPCWKGCGDEDAPQFASLYTFALQLSPIVNGIGMAFLFAANYLINIIVAFWAKKVVANSRRDIQTFKEIHTHFAWLTHYMSVSPSMVLFGFVGGSLVVSIIGLAIRFLPNGDDDIVVCISNVLFGIHFLFDWMFLRALVIFLKPSPPSPPLPGSIRNNFDLGKGNLSLPPGSKSNHLFSEN